MFSVSETLPLVSQLCADQLIELDEKPQKIAAFNILVHRLPRSNLALLRALSQFLIGIVNNSDVNKMTVRNVGIVFAPTLNIPAPVFSMFLTDYDQIFGDVPVASEKGVEVTVNYTRSDEPLSPRYQASADRSVPAYEQTSSHRHGETGEHHSGTSRGHYDSHSYGAQPHSVGQIDPGQSWNQMLAPNVGNHATSKAKRRESSLLFMDVGHRKNPVTKLRSDRGKHRLSRPGVRLMTD